MTPKLDYRWNLRTVMADRGMFATTDLIDPLRKRGIALSSSQVYRLVVERPERLSLKILMALLDILDCSMNDLIEPVATASAATRAKKAVGAESGVGDLRPNEHASAGPLDRDHDRTGAGGRRPDRVDHRPDRWCRTAPGPRPHPFGGCGGRRGTGEVASVGVRPGRPAEVLLDGRSPAPRAVGDLLRALRAAGATVVSPPCCAACGKHLRSFTRRGEHWYCGPCEHRHATCAGCGKPKRVKVIDRDGQPRCDQCADVDDRDPVAVIHAVVAELDPRVGYDTVADVVDRSCRQHAYQRKLAWAIEAEPALLAGDGHRAPLRVIPRFIEHLHAARVAGVVLPTCPGCHRVVRIDKPLNGIRVCRTCIAHSRREECCRCRAQREPVTRDQDGRPICADCFITDPANLETCIGCGRRRRVDRRTAAGPLCPTCPALPVLTCSICGDTTACGISRATGRPWCPPCQRRSATCSGCGCDSAIAGGTLSRPLCADCAPPASWLDCPTCGDPDHPKPGQCVRCRINRRLEEIMGPATAELPAGLLALRHDIATAEHPITAHRWLTKQPVVSVLSDLASGRMPLTHDAFDALPKRQIHEHLRQTLVAVGALPERDEELARLSGR